MFRFLRTHWGVITGDTLAIAAITLAGFGTHGTLDTAGVRIWSTFLPLLAAWLLVGGHVGVFDPRNLRSIDRLWRPIWAMILAAPVFGLIRAWFLGSPVISVVFVMVIGGVGALAMLLWRGIYWFWTARRAAHVTTDG